MGDVEPIRPGLYYVTLYAWPQWKALAHPAPMQCPVAFVENVMGWGTERIPTVTVNKMRARRMRLCYVCSMVVLEARARGSELREFQRAELVMKRERAARGAA